MQNYNRKTEGSCEHFYWFVSPREAHLHRLDGPAMEVKSEVAPPQYIALRNRWFYMGKEIDCKSQEEFESMLALMAFW